METIHGLAELETAVGREVGPTEWFMIDQARVNGFADDTEDHQWIHVDPERAAAGPFGGPVAHGFLTLSLILYLMGQLRQVDGVKMGVNYGLDRVRFAAPVAALGCSRRPRGAQALLTKWSARPDCTGEGIGSAWAPASDCSFLRALPQPDLPRGLLEPEESAHVRGLAGQDPEKGEREHDLRNASVPFVDCCVQLHGEHDSSAENEEPSQRHDGRANRSVELACAAEPVREIELTDCVHDRDGQSHEQGSWQ